jgi:DNA-binding NtrC family response regulator
MSKELDVLVASANFEHRRSLIRILEEFSLNVISVSTCQQAEEVLSRQRVTLMFSDERLPDGSYRELLNYTDAAGQLPQVVLTTGVGDSIDAREMERSGVLGTLRYPYHATDVELQILRAAQEERVGEESKTITQ